MSSVQEVGAARQAQIAPRKPRVKARGPSQGEMAIARKMLREQKAARRSVKPPTQVTIEVALSTVAQNLALLEGRLSGLLGTVDHAHICQVRRTVEVATEELERLQAAQPATLDDFSDRFWHVHALIRCARVTFGHGDAACMRILADLDWSFGTMSEMVELSERAEVAA